MRAEGFEILKVATSFSGERHNGGDHICPQSPLSLGQEEDFSDSWHVQALTDMQKYILV